MKKPKCTVQEIDVPLHLLILSIRAEDNCQAEREDSLLPTGSRSIISFYPHSTSSPPPRLFLCFFPSLFLTFQSLVSSALSLSQISFISSSVS